MDEEEMNLVRETVGWRDGRGRNEPGERSCGMERWEKEK